MMHESRITPAASDKADLNMSSELHPTNRGNMSNGKDGWPPDTSPSMRMLRLVNRHLILGTCAVTGLAGWAGYSVWLQSGQLTAGVAGYSWTNWALQWSVPSLVCVGVAALAILNRSRYIQDFAQNGRSLLEESQILEERLDAINDKILLARDRIAHQSHELEALGQLTTSNLVDGAKQFQQVLSDNLEKAESVASSSKEAAHNIEKLKSQLPGIVVAAKEVTNGLANAGRTAHLQLEDMVAGFHRLNEFGLASGHQVHAIRAAVAAAADELSNQLREMAETTERRFAALVQESETHRQRLEQDELAALTSLRSRASAIADEVSKVRTASAMAETQGLEELRERLATLREDGARVSAELSAYEASALSAWTERSAQMATQIAQHRQVAEAALQESVESMSSQLAKMEQLVAAHHQQQLQRMKEVTSHCAEIEQQVTSFSSLIQTTAAEGGYAGTVMEAGLTLLEQRLSAGRATISATQDQIADLSNAGERLLELIQASSRYTADAIPAAMGSVDASLSTIEQRVQGLLDNLNQAGRTGSAVADHVLRSRTEIAAVNDDLANFHQQAGQGASAHAYRLLLLREQIENARSECMSLADTMETTIDSAITRVTQAAHKAEEIRSGSSQPQKQARPDDSDVQKPKGKECDQHTDRLTLLLGSGPELLEEEKDPAVRKKCFDLLGQSVAESVDDGLIPYMPTNRSKEAVAVNELRSMIAALVGKDISINWGLFCETLPKPSVAVLIDLAKIGKDALEEGGSLDIASDSHDGVTEIVVRASGQRVTFSPDIGAALAGNLPEDKLSGRTAPAARLHRIAAASGVSIQHHAAPDALVLGAVIGML